MPEKLRKMSKPAEKQLLIQLCRSSGTENCPRKLGKASPVHPPWGQFPMPRQRVISKGAGSAASKQWFAAPMAQVTSPVYSTAYIDRREASPDLTACCRLFSPFTA